ncbi:MAG TPA: hypothetical protein VES61_04845 [Gaiellaceae bacterium]|nr:hypothetical protein [Gaiellaceae bacterium]
MPTLLIFGARNLGRAIAGHMAERGWSVAAVARSEETVGRLRDEFPDVLGIAGDAESEADVSPVARPRRARRRRTSRGRSPTSRASRRGRGRTSSS